MASVLSRRLSLVGLILVFVLLSLQQGAAQLPALPTTPMPTAAAQQPIPPRPSVQDALNQMGIVGYSDRLSVQPGETVRFMVSSKSPQYRVDIVRLIHGDPNPNGPGMKEEVIATPTNREYPGKVQRLPMGSYVTVPDAAALRLTGSFTITGWIAPTVHNFETNAPTAAVQGILAKWSPQDQNGYGLFLENGNLALWIGSAGKVEKVVSTSKLRPRSPSLNGTARGPRPQHVPTTNAWYFVAATFDAATGRAALYQQPLNDFPFDPTRTTVERTTSARAVGSSAAPLLMGASWADAGQVTGHYNGKLDGPRIYGRALTAQEIDATRAGRAPADAVAAWNFAAEMATNRVVDTSSRKLNGETVNFPTRAVTGHNWTGAEMDFNRAPDQYNALYFHDDDLEDAKWEVGFEFRLPDPFKSGVYAARLRTGDSEDYVPFFVRPKKGATTTARIAYLIPTFSYLAYGSTGGAGFAGLSLYSHHTDGTGFTYSSKLRPITNMRPKIPSRNPWQFMADTHLLDWLEVKGFNFDIITDGDLHDEGAALLAPYKVVLTGTHPEYTSPQMHAAIKTHLDRGGRFMYMGGNGFYWVTIPDPTGRFVEVRRRDGTEAWQGAPGESTHSLTGEPGGLWRFRGHAPQALVGVGFTAQGFDKNSPFRRMPGSFNPRAAFIFEGIGRDEIIGDFPSLVLETGAGGSELDRVDYALGSPAHTLVVARSFGHSDAYQQVVEEVNTSDSRQGGTINPLVYADLAFFETSNGGAVFSTGSIAWSGSLSYNNYTNNVSRLTENVLRRFAADAPLPAPTSANYQETGGQQ